MKLEGAYSFYGSTAYPLNGLPEHYNGNDDEILAALQMTLPNIDVHKELVMQHRPAVPGFAPEAVCFTFRENAVVVTYIPEQ